MRKPEQYRIENHTTYYRVLITWGLLDTEYLACNAVSVKQCRELILRHARAHGVSNPIILR